VNDDGRAAGRTADGYCFSRWDYCPPVRRSGSPPILGPPRRASATYQTITSLSADFVQVVANPMIGTPDTTRGRLYQMRPSRFSMRFTAPKGDRIVADGRFLWLYTPSTTPAR